MIINYNPLLIPHSFIFIKYVVISSPFEYILVYGVIYKILVHVSVIFSNGDFYFILISSDIMFVSYLYLLFLNLPFLTAIRMR